MKTNRSLLLCCAVAGSVLSAATGAQPPESFVDRPQVDPSRIVGASRVRRGDFSDPGNEKARHFARERGISPDEAASQLRRQAALTRFIERLRERHPDKFS